MRASNSAWSAPRVPSTKRSFALPSRLCAVRCVPSAELGDELVHCLTRLSRTGLEVHGVGWCIARGNQRRDHNFALTGVLARLAGLADDCGDVLGRLAETARNQVEVLLGLAGGVLLPHAAADARPLDLEPTFGRGSVDRLSDLGMHTGDVIQGGLARLERLDLVARG